MTTDDERPSGTGLRETVERVVERMRTRRVDHRHEDEVGHWGVEGRAYFYAGDIFDDYEELRQALAAHPDAAAGTTVEEWGFQWPEGIYHEGDGIYAYPNPGTEETAAARKTHRTMGATIYRRTRTTYADTVTEWEKVDD